MEHNGFLEPVDVVYSQWGTGVYSNILSENYKALLSYGFDSFDANILCRLKYIISYSNSIDVEQLFRDYPYFESLMLKDAAITSHIDYGKHLMKIWAVYKTAFKSADIF